ncbi:hypothetical protein [Streptomyces sp. NPDC090445]|uniref:hypothetical protein n=1 Tax=Streptomyces sp. NPDC090445 TaxID=3365963 RepID=UPI003819E3AA
MKHDETLASREGLTTEELARPRMDPDPDAADTAGRKPAYPGDATPVDDTTATTTGTRPDADLREDADTDRPDTDRPDTDRPDANRPDPADTSGLTAATARSDRAEADTAQADTAAARRTEEPDSTDSPDSTPLMPESEAADFRDQWSRIQTGFVDDPKESVRAADSLVAAVMQHLAGTFASHKEGLEKQWSSGGDVPTEDLRLALQRYRSFFNRLLTT